MALKPVFLNPPLPLSTDKPGWTTETHQQGAWRQSVKWNISEEDVHSSEQDNWLEPWLSQDKRTRTSYKKQIKESQTQTHKGKGVTVVLDRMENEI